MLFVLKLETLESAKQGSFKSKIELLKLEINNKAPFQET
jgi:hypothetical protein